MAYLVCSASSMGRFSSILNFMLLLGLAIILSAHGLTQQHS